MVGRDTLEPDLNGHLSWNSSMYGNEKEMVGARESAISLFLLLLKVFHDPNVSTYGVRVDCKMTTVRRRHTIRQ